MKKLLLIIPVLFLLTGCAEEGQQTKTDQCLRAKLFQQCLDKIPEGPIATKYNDWDEVVKTCDSAALYQSKRKKTHIKDECLFSN